MNRMTIFLAGIAAGAAAGAGAEYVLDPVSGTRRRAVLRQRGARAMRRSRDFLGKAGRDLRNRASGVAAGARQRLGGGDTPDAVQSLPGVRDVENRLETHTRGENVPALQGGVPAPGEPPAWRQRNWAPALRLATGVAVGVGLLAAGAQWMRAHGRTERANPERGGDGYVGAAHEIYGGAGGQHRPALEIVAS